MNTRTPGNEEKILWKCGCGWEKVTTFRGLRIHQGKRKCGQKGQQQPCTAVAGETRGTESQFENHRVDGPNVAEGKDGTEEEGPLVEGEPPRGYQDPAAIKSHRAETKAETKKPSRRSKLKWPKSSETEAWRTLDIDLTKTLEGALRGGAEYKLNQFGDILYQACKNRLNNVMKIRC
ncbi:hypothetical protein G5714_014451 [Onychostoma macrolepis]|uniref:Uncharacterized protein n=1 Tax=Onychostoma macrolepis TaxID=369639 RepID=A0A7J6CD22_9TELE|nr:hypothetical protein G5714_014451 [Onychostoma macrolepis]